MSEWSDFSLRRLSDPSLYFPTILLYCFFPVFALRSPRDENNFLWFVLIFEIIKYFCEAYLVLLRCSCCVGSDTILVIWIASFVFLFLLLSWNTFPLCLYVIFVLLVLISFYDCIDYSVVVISQFVVNSPGLNIYFHILPSILRFSPFIPLIHIFLNSRRVLMFLVDLSPSVSA